MTQAASASFPTLVTRASERRLREKRDEVGSSTEVIELRAKRKEGSDADSPPVARRRIIRVPRPRSRAAWIWRHPVFQHYNRLVVLVWAVNLGLLGWALSAGAWWAAENPTLRWLADAALVNLGLSILVRQQRVVNALFWLATRGPVWLPLAVRWNLGKVFHFGGLHSGGAVAGTIWAALFAGTQAGHLHQGLAGASAGVAAISGALVMLLVLIVIAAQPAFRRRWHNSFELVHRFCGWTALLLVWLQTLLFVEDQRQSEPYGEALLGTAAFWLLLVITVSVISPWWRLKRVPIDVEVTSSHAAIVTFRDGRRAFPGSTTAISLDPLAEWHSFANVPRPGTSDYRIIISRAGDWTGRFIDNPPSHVWVKGIITAGVANIETLFSKVLYVATGSGIGPVLPHLIGPRIPTALVWATRNPRKTYGDALVDEILAAQPDAKIFDTDVRGKPNLELLAWAALKRSGAEAVIVISNPGATERVVRFMEARGVPAFGAIFDS